MKGGGGVRRHEQRGGSVEPHPLPSERRRQVAVIGSSGVELDFELGRLAWDVGRLLAEAGVTVVCGGLGGVMEAVCRGATEAGGEVVGIVPGNDVSEANPHCTHVVATGIGHARNLAVVSSGDAVIAIGGEWGTLLGDRPRPRHRPSRHRPAQLDARGPRADGGRPRCPPRRVRP